MYSMANDTSVKDTFVSWFRWFFQREPEERDLVSWERNMADTPKLNTKSDDDKLAGKANLPVNTDENKHKGAAQGTGLDTSSDGATMKEAARQSGGNG